MKKIVSLALTCVLLTGLVLSLASCGLMFGTYKEVLTGEVGFKFTPFTITLIDGDGDKIITGTYEIEKDGDNRIIDIDFDDDDLEDLSITKRITAELYDGEHAFKEYEEDGTKYITIGITTFKKK